jgi:hypothetical protein
MLARPASVTSADPGRTGPPAVLAETGFGCLLSTRLGIHRAAV